MDPYNSPFEIRNQKKNSNRLVIFVLLLSTPIHIFKRIAFVPCKTWFAFLSSRCCNGGSKNHLRRGRRPAPGRRYREIRMSGCLKPSSRKHHVVSRGESPSHIYIVSLIIVTFFLPLCILPPLRLD